MAKFDAFKEIFNVLKKGKLPSDENLDKIPAFMLCRYLGTHQYTINASNILNLYYKEIPVNNQYKMIKQAFQGKGIYPKMIKATKADKSLDVLCTHYKINRDTAKEYAEFLSSDEIDKLMEMYSIKG